MLQYPWCNLSQNLLILYIFLCFVLASRIPKAVPPPLTPSKEEVSRNSQREGLASSPRYKDAETQTRDENPRATPETLLLFLSRA